MSFTEFARQKEMLFNRSQEVRSKLKQLVLMEEFKQCVSVDIKTYLVEQKVADAYKAATLADDYKLTHNTSGAHKDSKPSLVIMSLISHARYTVRMITFRTEWSFTRYFV